MNRVDKFTGRIRESGQSLVEMALFAPIFLIILAGLAEVSQIVIDQNRVANVARSGARFMAKGGENDSMVTVSLNTITQTLGQQETSWDIWAIRGKVNSQGDDFDEWSFEHVYGISNTTGYSDVNESQVRHDVLQELLSGGNQQNSADLRIVAAYVVYNVDSFLGLNAIPWLTPVNSISALSVMRIVGFDNVVTDGCNVFPIAIHEGIRSVTPPGEGSDPFPDADDFGPTSPKPEYRDFIYHEDNVPLADAKEGYVFKVSKGFNDRNFGWLRWNVGRPDNVDTLAGNSGLGIVGSLPWWGNSRHYSPPAPDGQPIPGLGRVYGYVEPGDATDTALNIGDWVAAHMGNVHSDPVRTILNDHINKGRVLRLVIWDDSSIDDGKGEYQASGFALFRLQGYNLTGGTNWILVEFIGWDESCGQ